MNYKFSYENIWSAKSKDTPLSHVRHAKYDFAVAYPPPETQPLDGLINSLQLEIDTRGDEMEREMAYYPHRFGYEPLRELTVKKMYADRGFKVNADEVVLTAGSGEAIALLIQAMVDPDDTVIVEEFAYLGTLNQIYMFGANPLPTAVDEYGLIPDHLENLLENLQEKGKRPKFIYTIPELQNPTGSTLPKSRRIKILDIAHKFGVPILEDDCYVDLRFEGERQPAFRALDDSGIVIYVASFSKLLSPGLRLGFFTGTSEVIERAMSLKHGSGPNQFAAYAVNGFLRQHMETHISSFSPLLKKKRDAMNESLHDHFGSAGAKWSKPEGGCYTWLTMVDGADIASIRDEVFESGVGYISGNNFSPTGNGRNCARLCFAFESPEKNYEGIKLLANLFREHGVM